MTHAKGCLGQNTEALDPFCNCTPRHHRHTLRYAGAGWAFSAGQLVWVALIWLLNCYPLGPNSIKGTPSPFSLFYKRAPSTESIKNPPEDKPDWSPLLSQSLMNSGKRLPRLITQLSGNQYQIYGGKNNLIHFLSVLFIAYFFLSIYHF